MGELIYSILRYNPSVVSGETINLGAVFYYPETDYREFYTIHKWARVSAFDDTLNIPLMKDMMLDIRDTLGTTLNTPNFDFKKFCSKFNGELYFDEEINFQNINPEDVSVQIEEIKKMYFQFEFDVSTRPSNDDQKKFLRRLLSSKRIKYVKNSVRSGSFGDTITYDYTFGNYGVIFINLNNDKIDNKTMNKVRAWAWNATHNAEKLQLIVLFDCADETRPDVQPALNILRTAAYKAFNIHEGFSDISTMLDDTF